MADVVATLATSESGDCYSGRFGSCCCTGRFSRGCSTGSTLSQILNYNFRFLEVLNVEELNERQYGKASS